MPCSMWYLSSPTKDHTCALALEAQVLTIDHQGSPSVS